MRLRKSYIFLLALFVIVSSIFFTNSRVIDFNKDIQKLGYEDIIEVNVLKDKSISVKKKDSSEFTQEEMDSIYYYFDSKYVKNPKYETNIIYNTNFKEITLKISYDRYWIKWR